MRCTYILVHYVTMLCICVTGSGPGCPDLDAAGSSSSSTSSTSDVDVIYYYDAARGGELRANASCRHRGHVFRQPSPLFQQQQPGGDGVRPQRSSVSIYCVGTVWSEPVPTRCVGQIRTEGLLCIIEGVYGAFDFCTTTANAGGLAQW